MRASLGPLQVAAEALRVCEQLVLVIRPCQPEMAAVPADLKELVPQLFSALKGRLAAPDQVGGRACALPPGPGVVCMLQGPCRCCPLR